MQVPPTSSLAASLLTTHYPLAAHTSCKLWKPQQCGWCSHPHTRPASSFHTHRVEHLSQLPSNDGNADRATIRVSPVQSDGSRLDGFGCDAASGVCKASAEDMASAAGVDIVTANSAVTGTLASDTAPVRVYHATTGASAARLRMVVCATTTISCGGGGSWVPGVGVYYDEPAAVALYGAPLSSGVAALSSPSPTNAACEEVHVTLEPRAATTPVYVAVASSTATPGGCLPTAASGGAGFSLTITKVTTYGCEDSAIDVVHATRSYLTGVYAVHETVPVYQGHVSVCVCDDQRS